MAIPTNATAPIDPALASTSAWVLCTTPGASVATGTGYDGLIYDGLILRNVRLIRCPTCLAVRGSACR